MPDGLRDLFMNGVSVVAVIYGTIEALKRPKMIKTKYAPLIAIAMGIACNIAIWLVPKIAEVVLMGAGLGIGASIGYSGFKKAMNGPGGEKA